MIKKQDTHLLNWFDFYVHDITEKNNLFFSLEKKNKQEKYYFPSWLMYWKLEIQ